MNLLPNLAVVALWCLAVTAQATPSQVAPVEAPAPGLASPLIDVQVAGHGEPQIILIPGLACPGSIWDHVVARFEVNSRCHIVSLAGFGGKPPVTCEHFLDAMTDAIIAYVREAKIDRPVIVGHSLGGVLALKIAIKAPDLPARLVIVDSLPFLANLMAPHIDNSAAARPLAEARRKLIAEQSPAEFAARERELAVGMVNSPENAAAVGAEMAKSDIATAGQAMGELIGTDLRPALGKIKCPTLVLAAIYDKVSIGVPREVIEGAMQSQYANLTGVRILFFNKARHFIMMDDLDGFSYALGKELLKKN